MMVILGITVAGHYKVQPLPLQTLPVVQPDRGNLGSRQLPVCEKNTSPVSGEENPWDNWLERHQISGWRGFSAASLQGEGSHERSVFFTDSGITQPRSAEKSKSKNINLNAVVMIIHYC